LQAGKVTMPTIFLRGREDWIVPFLNDELHSLRTTGVPTELVDDPYVRRGGWPGEVERDYLEWV
jgi:hypothetical protein